ncbi:MAG TPA: MotA/TolQ/ExbB proton channel family protein, partial [Candidatus Methylacidiphilales bacterium]
MLGTWSETFYFSWYVLVPLMLCSIISIAIIFERIISLRSSIVLKPDLARAIHDLGYGGKTTLIEQLSVDGDTPLSRLVRACLMYTSWPKEENAEAVQAYARREIVRLERGLVFLEVVTGLGPLLGLMGTILGLIRIFGSAGNAADLSAQGAQIAAGIAEALYCTVAG